MEKSTALITSFSTAEGQEAQTCRLGVKTNANAAANGHFSRFHSGNRLKFTVLGASLTCLCQNVFLLHVSSCLCSICSSVTSSVRCSIVFKLHLRYSGIGWNDTGLEKKKHISWLLGVAYKCSCHIWPSGAEEKAPFISKCCCFSLSLPSEPKKRQCKVLFEYLPQNEDELELKVGDVIDISEEVSCGTELLLRVAKSDC